MAPWKSEQHLHDHYLDHAAEFPGASLADYDARAEQTLDVGTYFEYFDDFTEEWRAGCYDRETGRLTILDDNDRIVSHFRCDEPYILRLTDSTYGWASR